MDFLYLVYYIIAYIITRLHLFRILVLLMLWPAASFVTTRTWNYFSSPMAARAALYVAAVPVALCVALLEFGTCAAPYDDCTFWELHGGAWGSPFGVFVFVLITLAVGIERSLRHWVDRATDKGPLNPISAPDAPEHSDDPHDPPRSKP